MKPVSNENQYITIQKASKMYGFSSQILRKWEKEGKITSQRTPNNTRMYRTLDLEAQLGLKGSEEILPLSRPTIQKPKKNFCYYRVQENGRMNDINRLYDLYPDHHFIVDSYHSKDTNYSGFMSIFTECIANNVDEIIIVNQNDILSTNLFKSMFFKLNIKLTFLNFEIMENRPKLTLFNQ